MLTESVVIRRILTGRAASLALAEDGYDISAPATFSVNVSNAPLVSLDFLNRGPRLSLPGEPQTPDGEASEDELDPQTSVESPGPDTLGLATTLSLVGDFADQQGVFLPALDVVPAYAQADDAYA